MPWNISHFSKMLFALAVGLTIIIVPTSSRAGELVIQNAVIQDSASPLKFNLRLVAGTGAEPGLGYVNALLSHARTAICSAHGASPGDGQKLDASCGTAGNQTVWMHPCRVKLRFHGLQHSDHPFPITNGTTSISAQIWRTGDNRAFIDLRSKTDAGLFILRGTIEGDIRWSHCPA